MPSITRATAERESGGPGRGLAAAALLIATVLPAVATGDPQTTAQSGPPGASTLVIRGTRQYHGERGKPVGRPGPVARQSGQAELGVIVMRPAPGSFMRETKRLAAEAEARDARLAAEEAREADRQRTRALQAVEYAADAVAQEARTRSQRYYPVFVPRPAPPQVRSPPGGAIALQSRIE